MAAISVAQIIKEALSEIKVRQLMLTPENYTEVYNEISSKYGFTTEEKRKIEKYISRLSGDYKSQASTVNINTVDEFVAFLTARINRSAQQNQNSSIDDEKEFKSLNAFTRRILQAISMLHNKEAKAMAEASMQLLSRKFDASKIDAMREKWFDIVSNYNDEYLDFLKYYGVRNFDDLQSMMSELDKFLTVQNQNSPLCEISDLIVSMLQPSISTILEDDIEQMANQIKQNPICLSANDTKENIKKLIERRIEADRDEIGSKISSLNGVLVSISDKISDLSKTSHISSQKAHELKADIKDISFDASSFEQVRNMLFNIASTLEIESRELGVEMDNKQATISELQNRITTLENELATAKAESKEDFLTKTANKRALMEELRRIEEAYKRYGTDYSLCFMDIDFFKKINDNYGHDAGDAILATVAMILRKYSRAVDFVGRYGGEEFVVLLPSVNLNDGVKFADKLRKIIENFKFMYKGERINVTISSGVATRSLNINDNLTLESADKMLYAAKNGGRNQVMPQVIEK
ncbi:diguanylate cyclase [Campylobacter majalis]|uniref:diguanylate cyclase n=1 Tax=Campylobacter majalis TaxID=2790656 RepID=UPI003D69BDDF